jgi:outer membrane protein assembly factor BamB
MIVSTSLSLIVALCAVPDDWSQWRGPGRNGISTEADWASQGQSESLWSRQVGLGYSCVAIANGRLFTIGFDEESSEDVLWCLDPATGEAVWSQRFESEPLAQFHGGGTLTTPVVDGDVLFTTNRYGRFFCRRVADGEVVWERDYMTELGLERTFHGFSASPLLLDERLYLVLGGTIIAAAKADGEVHWKTEDLGDGGYANAMPFDLDGRPCLAAFIGKGLLLLDRATGEQLGLHPWQSSMGGVNAATPLVLGDRIFISSAYQMGCALLEFDEDAGTPHVVWESKVMRNKVTDSIFFEDHIYGFDESMLKCIDMNGKMKWRVRGLGMGAVSLADGRLIILSSKGELIVAEATPEEFREQSRVKVLDDGVYWTAPILHDGRIYCRNSLGQLVCRDHREAGIVAAASTPERGPMPAADDLFARHVEAIGGEVALRRLESAHIEGEMEILGGGITRTAMTIDRMAPDKFLLVYHTQFGSNTRGYDGEVGWETDVFYGDKLYEGAELSAIREWARFHADLDYGTIYTSMKTTGPGTFGDRPCWMVEAVTAEGTTRRVYFDRETGLLVGRESDTESMVIHADYKDFDGVKHPTKITVLVPETGAEETILVRDVTFDGVEAATFDKPERVQRLLRTPEEIESQNKALKEKYARHLGAFVADFEPHNGAHFKVVVDDGSVALDIPGQQVFALHEPDDEGKWRFRQFDAVYVTFIENDKGEIVAIRLFSFGEEQELPRVKTDA